MFSILGTCHTNSNVISLGVRRRAAVTVHPWNCSAGGGGHRHEAGDLIMIALLDCVLARRMFVPQALLLQPEADLAVDGGGDCGLEIYEGPLDAVVDPLLQLRVQATVLEVDLFLQLPVTMVVLVIEALLFLLLVLLQRSVLRHVEIVLHRGVHPVGRVRRGRRRRRWQKLVDPFMVHPGQRSREL